MDHDCGVCSVVRLSSARRENVPVCRSPLPQAFRGESGALSANERRPRTPQGKLARKKRRQSFLESVFYISSEDARASPPHAFATPGDPAMLESCPYRPLANCEGIRLRRFPLGSNAQVPANWAFLQILAQSPNILGCSGVTTERLVRCWLLWDRRSSTKIEQHGWRGNRRETSLRYCYQTCYHFLQKAARNRMNQGQRGWTMSLKYKEQHETRRNINQTHNPKVGGSNPPPATNFINRLRGSSGVPQTPISSQ